MTLSDAIAARYDGIKAEQLDKVAAVVSGFCPDPAMELAATRLVEMRATGEKPPAGLTQQVADYQRRRYEADRLKTAGVLPDGTPYTVKPDDAGDE